jgi:putative tricarboxylic transport membrane protein
MLEGILTGLETALTLQNLSWVVVGCLAGTVIGMIPGLGPISAIALMIPVSYSLDPAGGLIMMAGVYYGAVFGGSTSAILINAPGVASTVATSFDGYPMARAGLAGKALAIAAYASFAGGTLGAIVLLLFASSIALLALEIQSPEYVAFLLLAMSSVVVFAQAGERLPSAVTLLLGLMAGTIGTDQLGGVQRFTFGRMDLTDGIHFVLLVMATFALAEAFRLILQNHPHETQHVGLKDLVIRRREATKLGSVVGRSSILGFVVGVLPGAGATLASFFAYDLEKRVGDGSREAGVAAPEAANNAACTGSFVPLLSLGIPGSGTTAVLLGVMLAYGLQPGPLLITEQPAIFWGVISSMYIGNLVLLVLNLPFIPLLARLINVPYRMLIPLVVAFSVVGVYLTTFSVFSVFDIGLMLGIALAATVLRWFGFPLAPLLLGFILSGLFEENLRRTVLLSAGEWGYLLDRPVALVALIACAAVWLVPLLKRRPVRDPQM